MSQLIIANHSRQSSCSVLLSRTAEIMMLSSLLLLLSVTVSVMQCQPFTATISISDHYQLGERVTCKVTITNNQDADYYLLKRGTPLDAISTNIFSVSQEGDPVKFEGMLFQRTPPTQAEYVLIRAKSSMHSTIDVSQTYRLDKRLSYEVRLDSVLTYYQHNVSNSSHQHVSSEVQHFKMVGDETQYTLTQAEVLRRNASLIKTLDVDLSTFVKAGTYVTPAVAGTPKGTDIADTVNVYAAMYNILPTCYTAVDSNTRLYILNFGARYNAYVNKVKGAYYNIKNAVERYQFTFYFDGPECLKIKNVIAYTYHGSNMIYLCSLYRTEPSIKGENTKLGTVLHEFTHAVAYTEDITYGKSNCEYLARTQPDQAVNNADNYHYFTEELAQ